MTENKRYEQYLKRLIADSKQLYVDTENLLNFYDLINCHLEYRESIHKAPGALYSFVNGLQTSIVIRIHRLFDSQSLNMKKLINFAKTHRARIKWPSQLPDTKDLDKQLVDISNASDLIDKVKKQRDKNYAHLDTNVAVNVDDFATNNPLNEIQINTLIELSHRILIEHYAWKYQATIQMKNVNSIDINSFLELLRIGVKYQKVEFENSLND